MSRWRIWVAISVPILLVIALLLWPRSDGLDYIRGLGGKEYVELNSYPMGMPGRWVRVFRFSKTTPELVRKIGYVPTQTEPIVPLMAKLTLPNGRRAAFDPYGHQLIVFDEPDPDWLGKQWSSLKDFFKSKS